MLAVLHSLVALGTAPLSEESKGNSEAQISISWGNSENHRITQMFLLKEGKKKSQLL